MQIGYCCIPYLNDMTMNFINFIIKKLFITLLSIFRCLLLKGVANNSKENSALNLHNFCIDKEFLLYIITSKTHLALGNKMWVSGLSRLNYFT